MVHLKAAAAATLAASGLALAAPASAASVPQVMDNAPAAQFAPFAGSADWLEMSADKHPRGRARGHYKHRDWDDDDYYSDRRNYRDERVWRGRDGRYYCRKRDGTIGLIVGGAAGAILGREIDSRGDRTLGTVLGAAGGAILGKEIMQKRGCR